jgi:TPR repeat protein
MYQVGQGIEKNYTTALNYYLDALYNGDINARKYILNLCYENLNIL